MKNYYNNNELEFFISSIDNRIQEFKDKIDSLEVLRKEFFDELKSRGNE